MNNIGFQGKLYVWLHDYLSERYQRVVVQGKSSNWSKIEAGVPQGSVLGPLLFLIYINDLPEIVESNIRLFADDTTLFTVVDDMEEATLTLKGDLSALKYWADQWLVTLNPSKTESLYVTNKTDVSTPTLVFDGSAINVVKYHKHLGVLFSHNLTWNDYIDEICTKAMRRLARMSCVHLVSSCPVEHLRLCTFHLYDLF